MSFHHSSGDGLSAYGWDAGLEESFASHRSAGLVPARVVGVGRGACDVITETGPLRARLALPEALDPISSPCTGDWAALSLGHQPEQPALVALPARHGVIVRSSASRSSHGQVLAPGAATGEGIDVLSAMITGAVVLLGPSGAGKSTLGNTLLGTETLETGAVRAQDGKGRHTTVRRLLVPLPGGGVLIDTPGLRGVGLMDADEGLQQVFADIEELALGCRFGDCGHDSEPGCAVQAAIASGDLGERRLAGYRKLQRENEWATSRNDARLRARHGDRKKTITRSLRETYAFRDRQRRT
ncbi:GTPase RsgA [Spongiactinospora gelatinilytica]|uniref:GTPase RsgA n=1 Tax=Spongiactinospora gelatinilytica TaxID=2666298 RepID=A0A2W2EJV4_9ACTN|nr:GTPase RsgA [Spongiactinospora gelatinilytica]PZG24586.1 GTPase RsgA [Spongiactinospora gelatinilytica]